MSIEPARAGRRAWVALAVLALPCLLYSMDLTILNLAVPRIVAELAPSATEQLWIVDIYGFVLAGSLILMGNLGDRIGRRRLLLLGAALFGLASIGAAFATTTAMLIASRALLGVAGATLAPSTLAMIRTLFERSDQRTTAIGVWVASFSTGAALGPLLGGAILERFHWGAAFLVAVPVMLLLLLVGKRLLPEVRVPQAGPLDALSAALALAAVLLVILGFKQLASHAAPTRTVAALALGLVIGAAFVRRQRTLRHPLVDLHLLALPAFRTALVVNLATIFAMFGIYAMVALYLQLVFGLAPLAAGVWMLPSTLGMIAGSLTVPLVARRARTSVVMVTGLVISSLGLVILACSSSLAGVIAGESLLSLGGAAVPTLASELIVGSAPPEQAGAASGLSETSSELGGALGIALLGSLMTALYRAAVPDDVPAGTFAHVAALATPTTPWLAHARHAFVTAFQHTAAVAALVLLATAGLVLAMLRQPSPARATSPSAGSP